LRNGLDRHGFQLREDLRLVGRRERLAELLREENARILARRNENANQRGSTYVKHEAKQDLIRGTLSRLETSVGSKTGDLT
jgi:hypothetical protein